MERKDRDADIAARRENYQRGLIALHEAIEGFTALTGVDLTGDVDVSGRHMGEVPYLKVTAERLAEITVGIEAALWESSVVSTKAAAPATVIPFERPVLSARRPGMVKS